MLSPFAGSGVAPPCWLATAVPVVQGVVVPAEGAQVLRTYTFSMPLATFDARFEALVENATYWPVAQVPVPPHLLTLGYSASAFAGDVPLGVETSFMLGAHEIPTVVTPPHVSYK